MIRRCCASHVRNGMLENVVLRASHDRRFKERTGDIASTVHTPVARADAVRGSSVDAYCQHPLTYTCICGLLHAYELSADELLVMRNLAAADCVQAALIAPGKREQNWEEAYDGALGISDHWMMLRGV